MTGLAAALVVAQRAARPVEKDSTNSFHRYKYASSEDVIQTAREALTSAGLALYAHRYVLERVGEVSVVEVSYRLVHEGGEVAELSSRTPVLPEKGRPEDKALAAAKTYDLAYTLRGLLLLPRVEEGTEVDQRDDRHHEPRPVETTRVAPREEPRPAASDPDRRAKARAIVTREAKRLGRERAAAIAQQESRGVPRDQWTDETWELVAEAMAHARGGDE